jgi:hypothetical protein
LAGAVCAVDIAGASASAHVIVMTDKPSVSFATVMNVSLMALSRLDDHSGGGTARERNR